MIINVKRDQAIENQAGLACFRQQIDKADATLGYFALAWLVLLHFMILNHAGALWRDEVNSVNISQLPSLTSVFKMNEFESYPVLWLVILRCWYFLGLGTPDSSLRILGLIMGLGIIAALWWSAQNFHCKVPLISIAIFCCSPSVIRYGDSMRAYGCGMLLMLLMLTAIWRLTQKPTMARTLAALAISIMSVHCLYYNSILLFVGIVAGVSVCLRRNAWKTAGIIIGIGGGAALSLMPYVPMISRVQRWNILVKVPINVPWLGYKFYEAISPSGLLMIWVWIGLYVTSVLVCFDRFVKPDPEIHDHQKDLPLFVGVALLLGLIVYILFLRFLSYLTQPWYYLLLMAFLAVLFEAAIQLLVQSRVGWRILRLVSVAFILLLTAANAWRATKIRMTNVDLISAKLESVAKRNDLIVLHPWWPGMTFSRYFKGSTPWVTLPEIADHSFARYDLLKTKMAEAEPIKPILEQITQTLKSGHQVWILCALPILSFGEKPEYLPPAPNGAYGWYEGPYELYWILQAARLVKIHAQTLVEVPVPVNAPINTYEDYRLFRVDGWRSAESE